MRIKCTKDAVWIGDIVVNGEVADKIRKMFSAYEEINVQWNTGIMSHVYVKLHGTNITFYGGNGFKALDSMGVVKNEWWPWLEEIAVKKWN